MSFPYFTSNIFIISYRRGFGKVNNLTKHELTEKKVHEMKRATLIVELF